VAVRSRFQLVLGVGYDKANLTVLILIFFKRYTFTWSYLYIARFGHSYLAISSIPDISSFDHGPCTAWNHLSAVLPAEICRLRVRTVGATPGNVPLALGVKCPTFGAPDLQY